jgi:hypothetical protein
MDFIGSTKEFVDLFKFHNQTSGKSLQNITRYLLRLRLCIVLSGELGYN